ncbi:DUF4231 domain-containing protein [Kovacikia minuta CCNUW1]|uniref:DUF4231 domain-containing protein n=1 Tax=Kovacikia minuta TaxID=2931930 RepID=UPI001CCBEB27|nr:DUF4231 domain-containing protein [Kovacikia minuta]UBF24661.1 DUF4231 domain-containing protein [Kovacikia minuta CCNUW1]
MTNASDPNQVSRSQILEDAWFRFAKYDKNATIAQKRFIRQRKWTLILGVAATTLAVLYSVLEGYLNSKMTVFPTWTDEKRLRNFLDSFHNLVVVIPILITILVAFSVKFNMGINWVMLRSSAEALKKEIFRYRMQVDEYSPSKVTVQESRDVRLAKKVKTISKRLMETPVNQTDLLPYKGNLPPVYSISANDDGFSDLTAEQYLIWRVEDQFSYYQKKAARLGREYRHSQALIIILGGVGALLAALKFDVWIAVSNALAAAFTSYLEFKRVETNVIACNISAADLYDIRVWWHSLSPEIRKLQTSVETLVSSTEAVLQTENSGWLQEMREALSEIYGEKKDTKKEIHPAHNGQPLDDPVLAPLQPEAKRGEGSKE